MKENTNSEKWDRAQLAEAKHWAHSGSDKWELLYELTEHYRPLSRALSTYMPKNDDLKGLEIGVGPLGIGFLAVFANAYFSEIVGIDPLPKQEITADDELIRRFGVDLQTRVKYVQTKGEDLSFEDESLDVVSCVNVLDHTDNPDAILREVARVLKKGGFLILGVHTRSMLGTVVWNTRRLFNPKNPLYVAHPHSWRHANVQKKLNNMQWRSVWVDGPSLRGRTIARTRMSYWILEKT